MSDEWNEDPTPTRPESDPQNQPGNEAVILDARREFELARLPKGRVWDLTPEHFVQVVQWLLSRLGYKRVAQLCKAELKLPPAKCPSYNALWEFWSQSGFWQVLLKTHRRHSAQLATEMGEEARNSPVDWAKANADRIQQVTFELLHDPSVDPKVVKNFVTASLKLNDQAATLRRITLLEAQQAKAKETVQDTALTPEQREAKLKEIFGIA